MAESATNPASSGPSLEDILWRNLDRWSEEPALVDREAFAEHLEDMFGVDPLVSEEFVERFFSGDPALASKKPMDVAEAIVKATKRRLQVYEFKLERYEYVVLEEDDKVVVVSDFGAFAVQNDDALARSIRGAVVPEKNDVERGQTDSQPRAYLVRKDGTLAAMDLPKLAAVLDRLALRQVSLPTAGAVPERLFRFDPTKKTLSDQREADLLRQDPRGRKPLAPPPSLAALLEGLGGKLRDDKPPAGAQNTLLVLLPDGSLARPQMGSATRWKDMVSDWAMRAAFLALGQSKAAPVGQGERFAVQGNKIVVQGAQGWPGMLAQLAEARGQGIGQARSGSAGIRVLGDADLALAVARGAMIVPGLTALGDIEAGGADRFWMHPESFFSPTAKEKQLASRGLLGLDGELVAGKRPQLGSITGDPWADWALTTGGSVDPEGLMLAARDRDKLLANGKGRLLLAALARADATGGDVMVGPDGRELRLPGGAPLVGFRAPDGSFILNKTPSLRLAEIGRNEGLSLQIAGSDDAGPHTLRIGGMRAALPSSVFAALTLALERTAAAGGFRLPSLRLWAGANPIGRGEAMDLGPSDPRRGFVMLAGAPTIYDGAAGQIARLLVSLPFPSSGELHVGPDLGEALQAYLGGAAMPAGAYLPAMGSGALALGPMTAAPGISSRQSSGVGALDVGDFDFGGTHGLALRRAQRAAAALGLPSVGPLLSHSPSISGLPVLLARALAATDGWEPGPGAPVPSALRSFALQGGPNGFELVLPQLPDEPRRPLGLGEDEIVIPMPLWAQMGRGRLSATDQLMASRLAPYGYAPPLGAYQLVLPPGAPFDFTNGAPVGTPGIVQLAGPLRLDLMSDASGSVAAHPGLGRFTLGAVALDDGETLVGSRGRFRPDADAPQGELVSGQQAQVARSVQGPSVQQLAQRDADLARGADDAERAASFQGELTTAAQNEARELAKDKLKSGLKDDLKSRFFGSKEEGEEQAEGEDHSTLTGALRSAMRTGDDVANRLMPQQGSGGTLLGSGAPGMDLVAPSPSKGSSGDGSSDSGLGEGGARKSRASSSFTPAGAPSKSAPSIMSSSEPSAPSSGSIMAGSSSTLRAGASSDLDRSAGEAVRTASAATRRARGESDGIEGLPPGMWSGNRRQDTSGYTSWSYSRSSKPWLTAGGVSLSGLQRPNYPSLPTSLRFRYAAAPLWWSPSSRRGLGSAAGFEGSSPDSDNIVATSGPNGAQRALRAGLRAANSAATLWRSILVRSPSLSSASREEQGSDAGGMDRGWDGSASELSSLASRFDALSGAVLVAPPQGGQEADGSAGAMGAAASAEASRRASGSGPQSLYIAVDKAGRAGVLNPKEYVLKQINSLEMQIVAAVPPQPPSLEAMSEMAQAHTRRRRGGGGAPAAEGDAPAQEAAAPEGDGGGGGEAAPMPTSRVEGSVDAIAQRIYHRIRRRIASDRERFGG